VSTTIVAVAQSIAAPGDLARSVQDHIRLVGQAADQGAQLVLFPELSLTGYDRDITLADALAPAHLRLRPLQALADARAIVIIAGAPVLSPAGLHIGALCFAPGRTPTTYLKRHLHAGEEVAFTAGAGGDPLTIDGQTVCIAICADITHAAHAQAAAAQGATIYAASCFITPGGYATDAGLLAGYAREHRMAVLMANYGAPSGGWLAAGRSAIWSPDGALLAAGPEAGEAVVVTQLPSGRCDDNHGERLRAFLQELT
jgi:predicted amidohydrolase